MTPTVHLYKGFDGSWIIRVGRATVWLGWDQDEAYQMFLSAFEATRWNN